MQWCTREYIDTIKTAWNCVTMLPFGFDRRLSSRALRRLFPSPFRYLQQPSLVKEIVTTVHSLGIDCIFLNNMDAAVLAPGLRAAGLKHKIVYLSHGVELTDVINNLRMNNDFAASADRSSRWLGDLIKLEISIRSAVDAVVCISEEDRIFEYWLGAPKTVFLPRQVGRNNLELKPVQGRVGTVSTLDHGPNMDGIRQLAEQLDRIGGVDLRLIGGPYQLGRDLQDRFRSISYLGRLTDAELEYEAATWGAFVNPIFCQARGASTKVATALGWGLPVLTTPQGARGYRWNRDTLPLSESVESLADVCRDAATAGFQSALSNRAATIANLAPSCDETATMLRDFLVF